MEEEVVKRFQKFELSEGEDAGVIIEKEDYRVSQEECERSLVGKLHGEKRISFQGLKNTMTGLWRIKGELKVREIGQTFSNSYSHQRTKGTGFYQVDLGLLMVCSWFLENGKMVWR